MDVHESVAVWPKVMLDGLNDPVQVGAGTTVTLAVQVFVPPTPLSKLSVHVCVADGEKV